MRSWDLGFARRDSVIQGLSLLLSLIWGYLCRYVLLFYFVISSAHLKISNIAETYIVKVDLPGMKIMITGRRVDKNTNRHKTA